MNKMDKIIIMSVIELVISGIITSIFIRINIMFIFLAPIFAGLICIWNIPKFDKASKLEIQRLFHSDEQKDNHSVEG